MFSWGGNPGVGSIHRFRDAIENGWPHAARDRGAQPRRHGGPLRRRAPRACRSRCCAATWAPTCPSTTRTSAPSPARSPGEKLAATPAINPDVTIIHAQRADRARQRADRRHRRHPEGSGARRARPRSSTVEQVVDDLERADERVLPAPLGAVGGVRGAVRRASQLRARLLRPRQRVLHARGMRSRATATRSSRG